jgi:hypothetical protein
MVAVERTPQVRADAFNITSELQSQAKTARATWRLRNDENVHLQVRRKTPLPVWRTYQRAANMVSTRHMSWSKHWTLKYFSFP